MRRSEGRRWRPAAAASIILLPLAIAAAAVGVVRGQQPPEPVIEPSPVGVNYGAGFAKQPLLKQEAFALLGSKGTRRSADWIDAHLGMPSFSAPAPSF